MTAPTAGAPALTALLDELDRLRAAATPGEWQVWWGNRIGTGVDTSPSGGVSVDNYVGATADEDDRADYDNEPNPGSPTVDAALIVAAVNAVPRLTAAVRAVLVLADEWTRRAAEVLPTEGYGPDDALGEAANRLRSALTTALKEES